MTSLAAGNQVGDAVTALWTEGAETRVGFGLVASEVPLAIELEAEALPEPGSEIRLVRDQGERWVAGTATVAFTDGELIMLRGVQWEEPSQRVHDRQEVEWPATLRILDDRGTRETYQIGLATDISLGGAAIQMEDAPEVGSLVELKAHPRGATPVRAVGVVARKKEGGIGVAFLYLWGAGHIETGQVEVRSYDVRMRRAA